MPLAAIRRFTAEDQERLDASAQRFADRHCIQLDLDDLGPAEALDQYLWSCDTGTWPRIKELKQLWQACRCRALRVEAAADIQVGYGYVGRSVS
jgi:hypothetical protein